MGDHQVTMGFNTKSWSNDWDDLGVPLWLRKLRKPPILFKQNSAPIWWELGGVDIHSKTSTSRFLRRFPWAIWIRFWSSAFLTPRHAMCVFIWRTCSMMFHDIFGTHMKCIYLSAHICIRSSWTSKHLGGTTYKPGQSELLRAEHIGPQKGEIWI